jgi:hypothetical protein
VKFLCAVTIASIAGAALWVEHGHRTVTDAPTTAQLDALTAARACPDSENVPYTPTCLAFLKGGAASETEWRPDAAETASTRQPSASPDMEIISAERRAACADTDTVPYSISCIAFMSGWFWRPNSP